MRSRKTRRSTPPAATRRLHTSPRRTIAVVALAAAVLALALPALPAGAAPARDDGASRVAASWSWLAGAWSTLGEQVAALFAADGTDEPPAGGEIGPMPDPNGLTTTPPDPGGEIGPMPDPNG